MQFGDWTMNRGLRALRRFVAGKRGWLNARSNQVHGVHPQDRRELAQNQQRWVANCALDLTDVRPVYFGVERESFLRQALLASQ
jgi:hypothetical protein